MITKNSKKNPEKVLCKTGIVLNRENQEVKWTEFGEWYEKYKSLITVIYSLMVDSDTLN